MLRLLKANDAFCFLFFYIIILTMIIYSENNIEEYKTSFAFKSTITIL